MIKLTLPANQVAAIREFAGRDDPRPYLNSICFTNSRMVATDGAMLGAFRIDSGVAEPFEFIAPIELFEGVAPLGGLVEISYLMGMVTVQQDGGVMSLPAIEAKYPDWARPIPYEVSGEPGNYSVDLLSRVAEAAEAFGGWWALAQNGPVNAALIDFYDEDFIGVLMPLRVEPASLTAPEWVHGRD